jgi:hypothetical protein
LRDFVGWWRINVGVRKGKFGGKGLKNADHGFSITCDQAEAETKITQQQVSRWRNALKRPDYVNRIFFHCGCANFKIYAPNFRN